MALQRLNNGIDFAFGEKLQASDMNIAKSDGDDIRVASSLLSTDANQTLSLANGTTYSTTMSLTTTRVIAVPSAPAANSRMYFKFRHTATNATDNLEIRIDNGTYTGTIICTADPTAPGAVEGWAEIFWDGSTWRTLSRGANTNLTVTVGQ